MIEIRVIMIKSMDFFFTVFILKLVFFLICFLVIMGIMVINYVGWFGLLELKLVLEEPGIVK